MERVLGTNEDALDSIGATPSSTWDRHYSVHVLVTIDGSERNGQAGPRLHSRSYRNILGRGR